MAAGVNAVGGSRSSAENSHRPDDSASQRFVMYQGKTRSAATRRLSRRVSDRMIEVDTAKGGLATTRKGLRGRAIEVASPSTTLTSPRSVCRNPRARPGCSSTAITRAPVRANGTVSAPVPAPRSRTSSPSVTHAAATTRCAQVSESRWYPHRRCAACTADHHEEDAHHSHHHDEAGGAPANFGRRISPPRTRYRAGMRRALPSGLAILLLVAAGAAPTRAGALSYLDPAGDATALGDVSPPRPSDPELDLLDVSWSTTSDDLVVDSTLAAIGEPIGSNGWAIAQFFHYEGIDFEVLAQDVGAPTSSVFGDGVYLRVAGDSTTEYPCVCRFIVRPDSPRVTVTVELHSIGSAVKVVDPTTPRPAVGAQFSDLRTTSYRVTGVLLAADRAAAPEGETLTV